MLVAIIVIETKSKNHDSDYMYIRKSLNELYIIRNNVKLIPIFLDGKTKTNKAVSKIKMQKNNSSKQLVINGSPNTIEVFWCFDTDDVSKQENIKRNNEIKELCDKNGYHYVWFCETIEEVYLGEKIPNKEKVNAAKKFLNKGIIPKDKLEKTELKKGTSNFKLVADSYFGKTSQIKE